jgi:hypothetical protein
MQNTYFAYLSVLIKFDSLKTKITPCILDHIYPRSLLINLYYPHIGVPSNSIAVLDFFPESCFFFYALLLALLLFPPEF